MEQVLKSTLLELELFKNVSPNTLDFLTNKGFIETFSQGEHLFYDKDTVHCFYILISGTASLYKTNSNGQNKIIFIEDHGALLNEVIFEDLPSAINCQTTSQCKVLTFYKKDLIDAMMNDFVLTQNVMNILTKRVRRLYRQLKNATSIIKIEKKLAAKLWKLGKDYGIPCERGVQINFPITVTSLADFLGSYRETVSRALKLLIQKELIIYENKQIIIPDSETLSKFFKTP